MWLLDAGRDDQRRREAAERADHGKRARVLQHRERGGERGDRDHQRERRRRRRARRRSGTRRRASGTAPRPRRPAAPARSRAAQAQAPADAEQDHRRAADRRQPQLDRQMGMLARVLGEEGEADEQDADAGLDDRVATEQPALDRREQVAARRGERPLRWRPRPSLRRPRHRRSAARAAVAIDGAVSGEGVALSLAAIDDAASGAGDAVPTAVAVSVLCCKGVVSAAARAIDRPRNASISFCWRSERRISQPNSAPARAPPSPLAAPPTIAPMTIAISRIMAHSLVVVRTTLAAAFCAEPPPTREGSDRSPRSRPTPPHGGAARDSPPLSRSRRERSCRPGRATASARRRRTRCR